MSSQAHLGSSLPTAGGGIRPRPPDSVVVPLHEACIKHVGEDLLGLVCHLWQRLQVCVLHLHLLEEGELLLDGLVLGQRRELLVFDRLLSLSTLGPDLHEVGAGASGFYT